MNFDPVSVTRRLNGADEDRRVHHSLNTFAECERDTLLDALFYYWQAKRGPRGELPRTETFRPRDVFGKSMIAHCHGIDLSAPDPANFVILDHPDGAMKALHGGMSNKRISEFPSRLQAEACMQEYEMCRRTAAPAYHEIDQIILGFARHYRRLMLPLADAGGQVTRIVYGIRYEEPPVRLF